MEGADAGCVPGPIVRSERRLALRSRPGVTEMADLNPELGRAVEEVLEWLGTSPETAAAALGINVSTLNAMRQGIVPMRSLVIRFAEGIAGRCGERAGAPAWWTDVDAWLERAGYEARRDAPTPSSPAGSVAWLEPPPERRRPAPAAERPRVQGPPPGEPPARSPGPGVQRPTPVSAEPSPDDPLARECYRPVYERQPWGETFVHIFWLVDSEGRRVFRRHMGASVDYKAEAARLKQDLATLPRSAFDRKYGRFRVQEQE